MLVIARDEQTDPTMTDPQPTTVATKRLCVRHQRMADEGTSLKLQQSLDALPLHEREAINAVWSNFSSSPHPRRALILQGILTMCCFSQLSLLTEQLAHLIRIDPFAIFPREVSLKVLSCLDATSLCRAAQVSKQWKELADDDILWRGICEQHIGQKCHKCGWGLPILEKKRGACRVQSASPCPSTDIPLHSGKKRIQECSSERLPKRQRSEPASIPPESWPTDSHASPAAYSLAPDSPSPSITRPWKDVYSERLTIERNWRRGRCSVRTLKGHADGVMCLQFAESLPHGPSFPVLITGSYDRTARVWNLETGTELRCLRGHTRAIRALQFDDAKLITASMDHTIRVWNWREGRCVRTLSGHESGVVCLNFDSNVLASGSVDAIIKVWNLRTQEAFTLRGHTDWVNSVQLWDSNGNACSTSNDVSADTLPSSNVFDSSLSPSVINSSEPCIDPGKMLFSASDDGTIRLWDLTQRTCVRRFTGHVAQVQSLKLQLVDECEDKTGEDIEEASASSSGPRPVSAPSSSSVPHPQSAISISSFDQAISASPLTETGDSRSRQSLSMRSTPQPEQKRRRPLNPVLISGSLDNTIKVWDIDTGKSLKTFFGHIEGVWDVVSDKMRLVSGSHDRTIKVWSRDEGRCTATLVSHRGAVTCLALGEDKIVSGSDDGDVKIWSFSG